MENFAQHMRIVGMGVTDNEVDTRKAAAQELAAVWQKGRENTAVLTNASQVAEVLNGTGVPAPALGAEVQALVQKQGASSFLYEERPLEVGVVAGVAAATVVSGGASSSWTVADVLAASLWCALSYQPPVEDTKREALRREIFDASIARCRRSAELSRERAAVADFADLTVTAAAEDGKITSNFAKATKATIDAMRRNSALDREELDFLWWAMLNRSRLLDSPLPSLAEPVRLVAAGIEAAAHLRRFPCDVHRDIVLRTLKDDPELDLAELHAALGGDRAALGKRFVGGHIASFPTVFPLLHSLATGNTDATGHAIRRRASDWGARALLEAGFNQILVHGIGKL